MQATTSQSQSQSHITIDGRPVSMSWCRARSGTCGQILLTVGKLLSCLCGAPSLTRGRVCRLSDAVGAITRDVNAVSSTWPPKHMRQK
jgi:hypothetical protein